MILKMLFISETYSGETYTDIIVDLMNNDRLYTGLYGEKFPDHYVGVLKNVLRQLLTDEDFSKIYISGSNTEEKCKNLIQSLINLGIARLKKSP